MGLTGCGRIVKYSMFVLNLLTFMGGFGLLGYGSYLRSNNAPSIGILTIILEYVHLSFPWLLIITAVVCIGVSFLGCCGAIKKIRGMLTMHFLLLMALLIGIFVGGVLSYQYKQEIESTIILQMESSLNESYGTDNHITDAWDVLQSTLQCCGIEGNENSTLSWSFYKLSTSWFKNQRGARRLHYVPDSCCKYPADTNNLTKCIGLRDTHKAPVVGPPILPIMTNDQFYSQVYFFFIKRHFFKVPVAQTLSTCWLLYGIGCWTVLYSILNNKLWVAMVLITTVAALLLIGMIMSICLCKRIEDEMYEEDEERFQDFIVS